MSKIYKAYLAGGMEDTSDGGLPWRIDYKERLVKIGVECILPQDLESKEIPDMKYLTHLKEHDIGNYIYFMRRIIKVDILAALNADMLVVHYRGEKIGGTAAEVTMSHLVGHPNFLITPVPLKEINGWFLSCFDFITETLDDTIVHIKKTLKMEN
jgi:hypothetical protein